MDKGNESGWGEVIVHLVVYIGWALMLVLRPTDPGLVVLVAAGVLAAMIVRVILHESGHALVAWALGMEVFGVTLGKGRIWRTWRLGSCLVECKVFPFCGLASLGLPDARRGRFKLFLSTLAGPLVDFCWAGACFFLLMGTSSQFGEFFFTALLIEAVVDFYYSLRTGDFTMDGESYQPDFRQLLAIPKLTNEDLEFFVAWSQFQSAFAKATERGASGGGRFWEHFVESCPLESAIKVYRRGAEVSAESGEADGIDAFCTYLLLRGDEEFFAEGEEWSRKLMELVPDSWTLKGTRGSFLVLAGQIKEGIAMLAEVVEHSESANDRAISATLLAWASAGRGNVNEAGFWMAKAREWGGGKLPVPWIEDRLVTGKVNNQAG